jgi:hypothetical protein
MWKLKTSLKISMILIILIFIAGFIPAASAATPCCPIMADYPNYPYGIDPYYQFPTECLCPFLGDAIAHIEQYPSSYWEYVIQNQNSQCSTCSGSTSTGTSFSYSNTPLIIPEKDSVITAYEGISPSFALKSKDQIMAKYLK